jgi:hypothetical protein
MILPTLSGMLKQQDFFIYTACDSKYFDDFGIAIINSIQKNCEVGIHMHMFNPTDQQLNFLNSKSNLSFTYEYTSQDMFLSSATNLMLLKDDPDEKIKYEKTINAMLKGKDNTLKERIQKTYYACARFIRLKQLINDNVKLFAIDIDAIVRSNIPALSTNRDFYIHYISGKKSRYLAGGIYFPGSINGFNFLTEYAAALESNINHDQLYWSIDQDALYDIVPKYNHGMLPIEYIDWNMKSNSYIWTAKGSRKDLDVFINEKLKYNF